MCLNISMVSNLIVIYKYIWNKVFRNGQSKICGRQLLIDLKGYVQTIYVICMGYDKGYVRYFPQVLLGPFLNILSHLYLIHFLSITISKAI